MLVFYVWILHAVLVHVCFDLVSTIELVVVIEVHDGVVVEVV